MITNWALEYVMRRRSDRTGEKARSVQPMKSREDVIFGWICWFLGWFLGWFKLYYIKVD
jgi:hypothetical protein